MSDVGSVKLLFGVFSGVVMGFTGCMTSNPAPAEGPLATEPREAVKRLSLHGDWVADPGPESLWFKAFAGDEGAVLELASLEGPSQLLERLEEGGPGARTAALVWPHVPTSWGLRGAWCEHSMRYQTEDWAELLRALSESATQRDAIGEDLEPERLSACERFMSLTARRLAGDEAGRFGAVRDAFEAAQSAFAPSNVGAKP